VRSLIPWTKIEFLGDILTVKPPGVPLISLCGWNAIFRNHLEVLLQSSTKLVNISEFYRSPTTMVSYSTQSASDPSSDIRIIVPGKELGRGLQLYSSTPALCDQKQEQSH